MQIEENYDTLILKRREEDEKNSRRQQNTSLLNTEWQMFVNRAEWSKWVPDLLYPNPAIG